MIVYIEGVDGSGKSTFAKHITKYLQDTGFNVVPNAEKAMVTHPWREDRIDKDTLIMRLRQRLADKYTIYIVDRGELSDIIYRTFDLDKYKALMSLEEFYRVYYIYSKYYHIVHCDSEMSEELMLKRGEDNEISIKEHQKLRYLFNQIMPIFHATKFDAAKSMTEPNYLDNICELIRFNLLMNGAIDNG